MRAPGVVRSTAGASTRPTARPPGRTTGTTSCSSARMPDSRSAPPAVDGAQHHRVARRPPDRPPGRPAWPRPPGWAPSPATVDQRDVRALGGGDQRDDAGRRLGQQPVEGDVQPRGVVALASRPPGGGQGVGQGRLLVEQLAGPVPHPPGLDQDDQGVRHPAGRRRARSRSASHGQPRLHAVELVAVGQPLPLVAAPRLGPDQARPPAPAWPRRRPARGSRTARRRRRSSMERWSATSNRVSRSTSSPHRSMRTGSSAVEGKTSTIPPRTASSPRCSTMDSRR